MEYTKKFKLRCIKIGKCSIGDASKKRKIPKQTIARWIRLYKKFGARGLENKKPGAKEKPINPFIEKRILNLWKKEKRSAYKMLRDLSVKNHFNGHTNNRNNSHAISKRQVDKIYKKHRLKV